MRRLAWWMAAAALCAGAAEERAPSREEVLAAMRKAAAFYAGTVSKEGAYHFVYSDDLSYGRSEHSESPTRPELQGSGTPSVLMAYLEAYEATGDRFYLEAARKGAHALVRGQLCSGGWTYDIEFDPAKRKQYPYRKEYDCGQEGVPERPPTTLDDNVTQAALRVLIRVDRELGFQDRAIHEAARFALEGLMRAQYPNGAWPQRFARPPEAARFPVRRASYPESWERKWPNRPYHEHYTFNDGSIQDMIDVMLEAARIYGDARYRASAEKGGDFILLAQMPEPQPAWAQQYDARMHPAWARVFEPPAVTGGESQGILRTLLVLYRETGKRKYLDAVPRALEYLERSVLPPVEKPSEARARFAPDEPVLARFYELRTNRPLYFTKGTRIDARGLGSARIDGYELSYSDESVITHYSVLVSGRPLRSIRKEYERLRRKNEPRPERLHGLSPWTGQRPPLEARPGAAEVRALIEALDERGAWTEQAVIGRADGILSVFAARDMVLTINGRAIPVRENSRLELFQGALPPRERVIRSVTFARNLERLAAWVAAR